MTGKRNFWRNCVYFYLGALRDICICKWKCQRCAGSQSDGKTERGSNLYKI